jgi:hypothetical protein
VVLPVFYNVDPSEMKNKRSILENICIYNHGEYRKVVGVEGSSKKAATLPGWYLDYASL